jgi:hypothetical protein
VSELVGSLAKSKAVGRIAHTIEISRLSAMLGRRYTDEEIKDAQEHFRKSLDMFIDKGADLTFHPLAEFLTAQGLPDLVQSAVKDLYVSQVSHLSKEVTDPLADSLFRPDSAPGKASLASFSEMSERPVFDTAALPREIVAPTLEDRVKAKVSHETIEKSVKEAVRSGRR